MTLTKLSKVFTKETLIFSKMVDEINTKKFGIKIKNNKQISNENNLIFHLFTASFPEKPGHLQ